MPDCARCATKKALSQKTEPKRVLRGKAGGGGPSSLGDPLHFRRHGAHLCLVSAGPLPLAPNHSTPAAVGPHPWRATCERGGVAARLWERARPGWHARAARGSRVGLGRSAPTALRRLRRAPPAPPARLTFRKPAPVASMTAPHGARPPEPRPRAPQPMNPERAPWAPPPSRQPIIPERALRRPALASSLVPERAA